MIQYWYKSQLETSYQEITKQIVIHASGSESINDIPGEFNFKLTPYLREANTTVLSDIDIQIGDEILITEEQINCIAYGKVHDPGRNLVSWDKKNNKAICDFSLSCYQSDFSGLRIQHEFTTTTFFEIVNYIMEFTDNSIGEVSIGKYISFCDDFDIQNYVIDKKTAREALTELCQNYDLFWSMKHKIKLDDTKTYIIERYIEINTSSGSAPSIDSTWNNGISNNEVSTGKIQNPIVENIYHTKYIAAESDFNIQPDPSVIVNYLELNAKVYESSTGELYPWTSPAEPEKFEYELDGYSTDVVYVSIWTKDKVKVQEGSTSSVLLLQSRYAHAIEVDNVGYFKSHPNEFFIVESVNEVDSLITEIEFVGDLTFTPTTGEEFEIVHNTPIYRKESEINYSSKGCVIDTDKKNYTKIKFLDLSEPNVSQKIIAFYKRIKDLPYILKNDESIKMYGTRYLPINLDDDLVLTESELQTLASKLLILKPQYKFSCTTKRYGIAPIGMSLPVKITNFITENFILNNLAWQHLHNRDRNKKSVFSQELEFSTYIGKPEKIIERFKRQKKSTSSSVDTKEKNIQGETIKNVELISWSFGAVSPVITSYSFSDPNILTINWDAYTGAKEFYIELSLVSDFSTTLSKGFAGDGSTTSISFVADYIEDNNTFYARLKVKEAAALSDWSEVLEIIKRVESYYFISTENLGYEELLYTDLDGTNQNDILTIPYAQRPIDFAVNDDYIAYSHHGTDIYGGLDMKLFNKTTNVITSIDYNIFNYNVFNPVLRGNYLYYGRNGNNIYRFNLTTFTSSAFYNAPYTLHDVSFDERYILLKYNFGFACYDTVTSTYTTAVYHSWRSARFLPNNKIIASADNGTYIFNNPSNVAVSYDFIPNTLSNGFVSDAVSNTEFITSGSGSDGNRIVRHFDIDGNLLKSVTLGSTGHVYSAKKYIP